MSTPEGPMSPGDILTVDNVRRITSLTREEWIRWKWHDITTVRDEVRMLVRCHYRTPEEAAAARDQWDSLAKENLLPEIDL